MPVPEPAGPGAAKPCTYTRNAPTVTGVADRAMDYANTVTADSAQTLPGPGRRHGVISGSPLPGPQVGQPVQGRRRRGRHAGLRDAVGGVGQRVGFGSQDPAGERLVQGHRAQHRRADRERGRDRGLARDAALRSEQRQRRLRCGADVAGGERDVPVSISRRVQRGDDRHQHGDGHQPGRDPGRE